MFNCLSFKVKKKSIAECLNSISLRCIVIINIDKLKKYFRK